MEVTGAVMKKRHPIRNIILAMIFVVAVALGVNVLVSVAAEGRRAKHMNEELSLGIRCLKELDYEAAIAHFDQVLLIDNRNVAAYIGNALAYSQLENQEMVMQTLTDG